MYRAGKPKLNELVTNYRLEEVNQAFADRSAARMPAA
jgi:Zn-dependent alcohol dehydrogenase